MNERDRTELERLIAAARPAGPGADLDARVREALLEASPARSSRRERRPGRRLSLAVAATVIVAAGTGFVCGRLTAQPEATELASDDVRNSDASSDSPKAPDLPPSVTRAPLDDERLASLLLQPRSREGLLGAGPVRVEVSQHP